MKLFKRKLQQKIKPWLDKPDIVGILGARQVGKTTLLNLLKKEIKQKWGDSKNILTYNLEDTDQLYALNRDPKYFNEYCILSGADPAKESIVLIDEIQYLDEPSHFLKYIADFEPSTKLIITGSTSINIKKYKDSVIGRKKLFTLFPLDFQEFLLFKRKNRLLSVVDKMKFRNFDLKKIDIFTLNKEFGRKTGTYIYNAVRGTDNEPVKKREARIQYSKITTLKQDSKDYQFLSENIKELCKEVHDVVKKNNQMFKSVGIHFVQSDLSNKSKSRMLRSPTASLEELEKTADQLLKEAIENQTITIRRLGVKVSELSEIQGQSDITTYF